jgi:protein phosphatase-4 regulatory subunit 3
MNPDKSSGDKSTRRRVKVYKLNDEGQWDDVGTGHVACVHHETFDALALTVKSEEKGGETILESKIQTEDIYQLQQDTLIVWQEPESGLDLALSFQEEQGCKEVWEQICAVQGRNPSESSEEVVTEEESYFSGIKLPPANLSNLQRMNGVFDGEHNSHMKERLANSVATQGYLTKLIELFKVVEESGNQAQLHLMFNIFKNLVLLNDPNLMETMFNDQNYMTTVGALEYDPEVSPKLEHRKYLQNSVVFKEVVPIRNADILKKIHQTFRIQYLKDVILPRLLDDMTFATINSIIYFNNVEIVDHLYKDTTFLTELFSKFKTATKEELVDLLGFLQEFCSLAKNLQIPQQRDFYQALAKYGMFEIFETALAESNIKIRLSCADLVNNVLSHDPVHFREFLLAQRPDYPLFHKLIDRVLLETDVGLLSQFVEVIRILVDTETMEETTDKEKFLTLFYQTFMKGLMAPIMDVDVKDKVETPAEAELKPARRQELCELLAYCCQHHGYHIKYFTLGNNIAAKVSKLLSSTQPKHVALAALRFFRAMVAAKDDFYNRHIMKFKLFDPIVQLFVANGRKYNLINSAVIELFDYIRKENIKALLKHVIENYSDTFKEVDYVETFKLLQLKYEQNKDYDENVNKVFSGPTKSPQRAAGDDVDDSYFFGDDDDDEEPKGGLVSYEDDEEKGKEKSEEEEEAEEEEAEGGAGGGEEEEEEEGEEEERKKAGQRKEAQDHKQPPAMRDDENGDADTKKRKRDTAAPGEAATEDDEASASGEAASASADGGDEGEGEETEKKENDEDSGEAGGVTKEEDKERDSKRLKFSIQSPKLPKISTSDS